MNTQVALFLGDELETSYSACIHHSEHYNAHYDGLRCFHLTHEEGRVSFVDTPFGSSADKPLSKIFDLVYQDINKVTILKKSEDSHINFSIITPPIINNDTLDMLKQIVDSLEELYVLKGYMMRITLVVPTLNIIDRDIKTSDFKLNQEEVQESNVIEELLKPSFNSSVLSESTGPKDLEKRLKVNVALKAREIQMFGVKSIGDMMSDFSISHKILILDNQNQNGKGLNLSLRDFGTLMSCFIELLYNRQNEVLNSWNADYMSFGLSIIYYDLPQIMDLLELELKVQENVQNNYCSQYINFEKVLSAVDDMHLSVVEYLEKLNNELPSEDKKLSCEDLVLRLSNEFKHCRYSQSFSFVDDPNFTLLEKINVLTLWGNFRSPEPGYSEYPSLLSLLYPIVTDVYKRIGCKSNDSTEEESINSEQNEPTSIHEEIDFFIQSLNEFTDTRIEIPVIEDILLRKPRALSLWNSIMDEVSKIDFDKSVTKNIDENISQLTSYHSEISKYIDSEFNNSWFPWLKRFFKRGDYNYNLGYLEKIDLVKSNLLAHKKQVFKIKYQLDFIDRIRSIVVDQNNILTDFRESLENEKLASQFKIDAILNSKVNPLFISIVPIKEAYTIIKEIVSNDLRVNTNNFSSSFSDLIVFEKKRSAYFQSVINKDIITSKLKAINVSASILNYLLGRSRDNEVINPMSNINPDWLSDYLSDTQDYSIELMFKENISPFIFMNQLDKSELLQKTYGLLVGNIEKLSVRLAVKKSLDELVNTNSELYEFDDPYKVVSFSFTKINNLVDCAF